MGEMGMTCENFTTWGAMVWFAIFFLIFLPVRGYIIVKMAQYKVEGENQIVNEFTSFNTAKGEANSTVELAQHDASADQLTITPYDNQKVADGAIK